MGKCRSGSALEVAPGAFPVPISMYPPNGVEAMLPEAAAVIVTDAANPDALARIRLTAFVIDGHAQEAIDDRSPTGKSFFFWSDLFAPGPHVASVRWGVFSQEKPLEIYGYNPNGYSVDVSVCIWGQRVDTPKRKPWWSRLLARVKGWFLQVTRRRDEVSNRDLLGCVLALVFLVTVCLATCAAATFATRCAWEMGGR